MGTRVHTDIATSAPANAATFNSPLGQLDDAITSRDYYARDYGVTGDGTTDDYAHLLDVINAATAGKGRVVLLGSSGQTFKFGTPISLGSVATDGPAFPSFVGYGKAITKLVYSGSGGTALTLGGSNAFQGQGAEIGGFTLSNSGTGAVGLQVRQVVRSRIFDISAQGFSSAGIAIGRIPGGAAPSRACYYNDFRNLDGIGVSAAAPATYGIYISDEDWANANNFYRLYTKWANTHVYQGGVRSMFYGLQGEVTQSGFVTFMDWIHGGAVFGCDFEGSGGVGVGIRLSTTEPILIAWPFLSGIPTEYSENSVVSDLMVFPDNSTAPDHTYALIAQPLGREFALPGLGATGKVGGTGIPTIGGINAGISGTPTVSGNDTRHTISFTTTGSPPAAGANLFTVNLSAAMSGTVFVQITAADGRVVSFSYYSASASAYVVSNQQNLTGATTYVISCWVAA